MNAVELTTWADQVLKKRLENVRGVGSVALVGGTKREINIYLNPQAMEAFGITPDQVAAVRNENQDLPWAPCARPNQTRGADRGPHRGPRLRPLVVARRGACRSGWSRWPGWKMARRRWRAWRCTTASTLLLSVQKAQGENTIEVVDGLKPPWPIRCKELPPGVRWSRLPTARAHPRGGGQRAPHPDRRRLLTVLIVFLFLNSWRSTVITGLTLPIALIGTFLFMTCSASPST
jgi:HAE1 family hydrophobic/amphiphilic exporter-1